MFRLRILRPNGDIEFQYFEAKSVVEAHIWRIKYGNLGPKDKYIFERITKREKDKP